MPPIKRIRKVIGDERHGGMWKVAYADFVTAMMAFFLLLWLINATTPQQKQGLAEYFTPTIGIKDSMGIGFKGGRTPSAEIGRAVRDRTAPSLVLGELAQGPIPVAPDAQPTNPDSNADSTSTGKKVTAREGNPDEGMFQNTTHDIQQELMQDLKAYKNDIVVQDTPEGLKIDMINDAKKPMFLPDGTTLTEDGKKILDAMANIIVNTPNNLAITGHTASGSSMSNPQYTEWELSSDRAQAARRFLVTTQLERGRVVKVTGFADRDPLTPEDTASRRNDRITIVLERGSYFRDPALAPAARDLISVMDSRQKKSSH